MRFSRPWTGPVTWCWRRSVSFTSTIDFSSPRLFRFVLVAVVVVAVEIEAVKRNIRTMDRLFFSHGFLLSNAKRRISLGMEGNRWVKITFKSFFDHTHWPVTVNCASLVSVSVSCHRFTQCPWMATRKFVVLAADRIERNSPIESVRSQCGRSHRKLSEPSTSTSQTVAIWPNATVQSDRPFDFINLEFQSYLKRNVSKSLKSLNPKQTQILWKFQNV